ncbi:MAG: hypothetical protein AAFQ60_05755 [Pseudomonadota bacterium]
MSDKTNDPPEPKRGFLESNDYVKHSIKEQLQIIVLSALRIGDAGKADQILVKLTTQAFWATYGSAHEQVKVELKAVQSELKRVTDIKDHVWTLLSSCAPEVRVAPGRGAQPEDNAELPISAWQMRDKFEAVVILIILGIALLASLLTAHANLVGTELDVFRQYPLLPWCMASLAPISAVALKTIYAHLTHDLLRAIFVFGLLLSMVISIIIWALLFAINYHGLGTELDIGGLLEDASLWSELKQTGFVVFSLSTEILVGAVLALRLSKIADRYAGDGWQVNREYTKLEQRWKAISSEWQALVVRAGTLTGALSAFDASLGTQIELARLSHEARRGQSDTPIL